MLLSVFQKKKNKNMLQEFITSALVIDDDKSEIDDLVKYLDEKDIWTKYYHPDKIEDIQIPFNNRKLIFLDLYLRNNRSSTDNIALIRKYFKTIIGNDFGTYGIVLWTKHSNHFDEFCEKIYLKGNNFTLPLFVVFMEKNKYLQKGNYEGILDELEGKLNEDVSSSFFIEWNKSVKKGSDKTITSLYNLFDTNEKKKKHLEAVLYRLACNFTGIPTTDTQGYDFQKDLVKALMDSLQFEVSNSYQNIQNLFSQPNKLQYQGTTEEKNIIFSKLNSLLLMDFSNLSQESLIPGNIYEVVKISNPMYIKEVYKKGTEINIDTHPDFRGKINKRIVIEVSPPCDFAEKKKQFQSRIIGGLILDFDPKIRSDYFNGGNYYTFVYPINIPGITKPQMIIFDFYRFQTIKETDLKDASKFEIIMKAKDKLFADILQKLSSHTARLGIPIMN